MYFMVLNALIQQSLGIFLPYLVKKLEERVIYGGWREGNSRLKRAIAWILDKVIDGFKIARFVNLILFLVTEDYRSVLERILRMKLEINDATQARVLDFTYVNRVIVWDAVGKVLVYFLPFINIKKLTEMMQASPTYMGSMGDMDSVLCGFCKTASIVQPHYSPKCSHSFCYYCVSSRMEEGKDLECPVCSEKIEELKFGLTSQ